MSLSFRRWSTGRSVAASKRSAQSQFLCGYVKRLLSINAQIGNGGSLMHLWNGPWQGTYDCVGRHCAHRQAARAQQAAAAAVPPRMWQRQQADGRASRARTRGTSIGFRRWSTGRIGATSKRSAGSQHPWHPALEHRPHGGSKQAIGTQPASMAATLHASAGRN